MFPAEARTALAPNGSAVPSSTTRAAAPAAAAVRAIAPTLPGSCTRSSTTSGHRAERAACMASDGVASCTRAMAITPCGVTVCVAARNAPGVKVTRDSKRKGSLSPSRAAMSSNSRPAALASESTRGPSRRAKPGSRRVARRRKRRTTSLSGLLISWSEGVFRNLHQPSKGTAVAHGQVSQHLAVDLYSGLAEAVHQLAVGQPRLPRGGIDASDPELPHLTLAAAAVAICIREGVKDGLVRGPEQELLREPEAFRAVEDRLVTSMSWDASLDSCHELNPERSAHRLAVAVVHLLCVVVVALALLRLVFEEVALPRARAHQLAGLGHANALGNTFSGLDLRHWRSPCRPPERLPGGWARGS